MIELIFFILGILILSRFFHHFHETKKKLTEIDKSIDDMKDILNELKGKTK
ncbi:MAG TPA: hypothetical protein VEY70_21035 [Metabacillus sp.]|nr:hypothetical protein [Metabacillus sp.]